MTLTDFNFLNFYKIYLCIILKWFSIHKTQLDRFISKNYFFSILIYDVLHSLDKWILKIKSYCFILQDHLTRSSEKNIVSELFVSRLVPKVKKSSQVKVMTLTFYFCLKILFLKSKSNIQKYSGLLN